MYFVYIVKCADNTLYTGYATDIKRRMRQHNGEIKGGAKYTADFDVPTENLTTTSGAETSGLYYVAPDGTKTLIQGDS